MARSTAAVTADRGLQPKEPVGSVRARAALRAAAKDLHAEALNLLDALRPEDLASDLSACAFAGAAWVRVGVRERAAPFLERDWSTATGDAAGLAGAALLRLGAAEPAASALRHALDAGARDRRAALVNLGRALTLLGRPDEALRWLDETVALPGPVDPAAVRALAEARAAVGDLDGALRILPERSRETPDLTLRAVLLAASGRHDEATVVLRDRIAEASDPKPLLIVAAELAEQRGRTGEAIGWLERALAIAPRDVLLLAHLVRLGCAHPELRQVPVERWAAQAIAFAEAGDPPVALDRAMARVARATVLAKAGDIPAAEASYHEALALVPDLPGALSGLGHLLLQAGRVGEAIRHFEEVRRVAPLAGWSHLIQARQVPDDPEVLERIEAAARRPSIEGPVRSGLLFTLAEAHERLGSHERAFALAREANDAARATLRYSPAARRAAVEREIGVFSEAFVAARKDWGHPSRVPVFVLGMPRSGTTLVEQILASHSRVHGAGELSQIGEQIARMESWERGLGSGLRYPDCLWDLTSGECRGYAERMLRDLQALAPSAARVIDKLPHNFQHVGLILLLFPNASIVHCRRDPRDVAVSNYMTDYAAKFGGMGFAYDLGWIGEQLVDHDRTMRHWHALFPGRILEVPYEALVEDTESWARRMLTHLGMDWEPGVLDFQALDRPVRTASVWQVRQPIYTSSRQRWRRHAAQLGALEEALSRVPPVPDPLPAPRTPPGLFVQAMKHLAAGRHAEARGLFEHLLDARPLHAAAHQFLGAALLPLGETDRACEAMRRSVELLPVHPTWFDNLAQAETLAGNPALAGLARERAARLRSRDSRDSGSFAP